MKINKIDNPTLKVLVSPHFSGDTSILRVNMVGVQWSWEQAKKLYNYDIKLMKDKKTTIADAQSKSVPTPPTIIPRLPHTYFFCQTKIVH